MRAASPDSAEYCPVSFGLAMLDWLLAQAPAGSVDGAHFRRPSDRLILRVWIAESETTTGGQEKFLNPTFLRYADVPVFQTNIKARRWPHSVQAASSFNLPPTARQEATSERQLFASSFIFPYRILVQFLISSTCLRIRWRHFTGIILRHFPQAKIHRGGLGRPSWQSKPCSHC